MRVRDGKIVEVIAFFDTIEFTDFRSKIKPQYQRRHASTGQL
jgi:hypothetical protein